VVKNDGNTKTKKERLRESRDRKMEKEKGDRGLTQVQR
jgi:hypothetical protein